MATQTLSGASRGLHRRVSEPEWVEGVCAGSTPGVGVGAQVGWGGHPGRRVVQGRMLVSSRRVTWYEWAWKEFV